MLDVNSPQPADIARVWISIGIGGGGVGCERRSGSAETREVLGGRERAKRFARGGWKGLMRVDSCIRGSFGPPRPRDQGAGVFCLFGA
eukprot:scaffold86_cov338-Pavlova_lutheri.AAC.103